MKRSRSALGLLLTLLALLLLPLPARAATTTTTTTATTTTPTTAAAGAAPVIIPALQQWTAGTGSYTFTATGRVVVDSAYATQLTGTGQVFAADLTQLTGATVTELTAAGAQPGDLFLTLGGTDTRRSAYTLTVGSVLTVQGAAEDGVFYGTRSVLQLLHQSRTVPGGAAHDWAQYAERGLMVDTGRKFFTVDWLRQEVKDLAYVKMNYLHLHLSDTYGFRLESSSHPEITSADHYTKQQITDLIALGAQYHVTVVPEIDAPGHLNAVLAAHPELRLVNSSGTPDNSFIDLSNPAAYTLIQDLISEYLPLFPAAFWHLGADEYVTDYSAYPQLLSYARAHYGATATAKDVFYGFVNWADALVRGGGKTMRMWNDGIKASDGTITVNPDITVDYWYNYGLTPAQLVAAGHQVMNSSWTPTYYVYGGEKPDTTYMYESWNPGIFQGGATIGDPSRNSGSVLHVWCDNPGAETEQQTAAGILAPIRALAQQTWGSPKPVAAYTDFQPLITAIGRAPGWPADTAPGDLALGRPVTVSSTETAAFPGSAATDGSYGTRWSSAYADPQWLQIDLGASTTVGRVKLSWEAAYAKAFQVQFSEDAVNWTTAYSTTAGTGGVQDLTGLHGSGRYLRIYLTQRGTGYGYSLWEVEAYQSAATPPPSAGHSYTLTAASSGSAADVNGGSTTAGAAVIEYHPTGGGNQQWTLQDAGNGAFHLVSVKSGLCLDVTGSARTDGAAVIQWTCGTTANQTWTLTAATGGGYAVTAQHSGKLLSVGSSGSTADGTPLVQAASAGAAWQRWVFTQAG
ncbi:family 20 glycosylhydrolase [Kitasatospora azatica]|uniref:family 20 glycosylhydrolase n=1 Tax=Kitasatospora azatica TaxID=58347 RepID=UPI0009FE987A|nr:family 20 glycosylhydrolase [Kitasatospora azatica]